MTVPVHAASRQAAFPAAAPLVAHLASFGDRPALLGRGAGDGLSYAGLARRVAAVAAAYAGTRRLVLLTPRNDADSVVEYLGALAADQVVLLADEAAAPALESAWQPDALAGPEGRRWLRDGSAHSLHPDLTLLLSTSGSTGSPKLVRLSRDNLVANAAAIADSLGIRSTDVAATTLPLHYCYGLSVLHSHLLRGAALLLTERSVVDECFWDDVRTHGVTTLPGVPHTFELLERTGFADRVLPSLRCLTQAGGRMAPARVRAFAELGQRRGFDLFVMYGATEATARMAVLPADLATTAPTSIGLPLPGTSFSLAPVEGAEPGVGELVFHGPNVMLGYAELAADLALGATVDHLRTGDLARQRPDGLWEVVGRTRRIAKVCGLRVDLDRLERTLAARGTVVACADGDDRVVVGVVAGARPVDPVSIAADAAGASGLAVTGVHVEVLDDLPRLPNGKVDYRALAGLGQLAGRVGAGAERRIEASARVSATDVAALYARLLGRPEARPTDSFLGLGGDSLSYVEVSIQLERLLGHLPAGWPAMPAAALVDTPRPEPRRGRLLETNVLMRAVAIITIVGTHANLFALLGGAHLLLAVAGFNLGRFQLAPQAGSARVAGLARAALRVAVPSMAFIGVVAAFSDQIGWRQAMLLTQFTEWAWSEPRWSYWFVEALVLDVLLLAALLAVPAVDRWSRRWSFGLPVALTVALLPTRYDWFGLPGDHMHRGYGVLWVITLGWAMSQARTTGQRWLVTLLSLAIVPGFFGGPSRHLYLVGGLLLLVWLPHVRVPAVVARLVGPVAGASLWIYLAHWQVYPHLEDRWPLLATLASLAVGVAAWWTVGAGMSRARRWLGRGATA
ncbi:AMP-dependent synthetase [Nocardioides gansuensis]|uniref:AMP-dependent synthetase n=1 Tax=Nocardioides gansuensis TaxID=2138300 RepID=A0A2T8FFT3_9ACTN|nr:non-ribosomal peptide synthetase [Nocardioides gansuensis]PVG84564.1 AMP-dependent synthetase [Nocardioides gansuensis]